MSADQALLVECRAGHTLRGITCTTKANLNLIFARLGKEGPENLVDLEIAM